MTTRKRLRTGILAVLCACAVLPVPAAEDEGETEGDLTFGVQWYAEQDLPDSAKFREYRDVPNGFVAERFLFNWSPRPGYFFDLNARDITQNDQRLGLQFGKRDLWKGTVAWQENPRLWTDRAVMLFAGQGGAVFTLDDTLQSAVQAAPASVDTTPADGEWDAGTKGALIKGAILNSANDVFVGHHRRTGSVGLQLTPTRSWTFGLRAEREWRSGTAPQSLGMYFTLAPAEVAAPLDFRTDTYAASAEYARERWNVGAQVAASEFETGFKSLTWDNQLALNDTPSGSNALPARGRLTLGADNESLRMTAYAGVSLPGRTRVNATVTRIETKQDDPFLPMTTNTLLTPSPLPAGSFGGEYRNDLFDLRVSSRPTRTFRWGAWARSFKYENESRSLTFADYVMTDYQIPLCANVNACDADGNLIADDRIQRRSLPYGYERSQLGGSVGFHPVSWFDGSLSFEREGVKREFSAVEDSDEDILKLVLDFEAAEWLTVRTTARRQERRADRYEAHYFEQSFPIGEPNVAGFNEGTRRFYWTDRDRDSLSVLLDVTPHEKFSIYAEAIRTEDTYLDPATGQRIGTSFTVNEDRNFDGTDETYSLLLAGRKEDDVSSYTLGFSVAPAKRFDLYADYTWETSQYGLETRYRCPGPTSASCPGAVFPGVGSDSPLDDWGSDVEDRYATANLGFQAALTPDRGWTVSADLSRSVGEGDIETHFVPGGAPSSDTTLTQFPRLETTLSVGRLALNHKIRANVDYALSYWYESWKEDNFASDFMEPYMGDPGNDPGSVHSIFLGMDFRDYTNHILSFLVRYRFR